MSNNTSKRLYGDNEFSDSLPLTVDDMYLLDKITYNTVYSRQYRDFLENVNGGIPQSRLFFDGVKVNALRRMLSWSTSLLVKKKKDYTRLSTYTEEEKSTFLYAYELFAYSFEDMLTNEQKEKENFLATAKIPVAVTIYGELIYLDGNGDDVMKNVVAISEKKSANFVEPGVRICNQITQDYSNKDVALAHDFTVFLNMLKPLPRWAFSKFGEIPDSKSMMEVCNSISNDLANGAKDNPTKDNIERVMDKLTIWS